MSGRALRRKKAAGSLGGKEKKGREVGSLLPLDQRRGEPTWTPLFLVSAVKSTGLPAAITAAAAETTTTTGSILPGLGLIDGKSSPIKVSAIQGRDRRLRFSRGFHLHKTEAP